MQKQRVRVVGVIWWRRAVGVVKIRHVEVVCVNWMAQASEIMQGQRIAGVGEFIL